MISRRGFLQSLAGLTASMVVARGSHAQTPPAGGDDAAGSPPLPQRKLGRSGEAVTMLGLGGAHVGDLSEADAQRQIELALEEGVRFFDTAAAYQRGGSERYYGRFLTPRHRDQVFVMTKTGAKTGDDARAELDASLKRLKTDRLDLWQIHSIENPQDVDARIDAGVLDAFIEAKQRGRTRYIGFTGHNSPQAHLRMLERLAERGEEMDTLQMPVNVVDPHYESFILNVLPKAVERGYGVLAMKTLAFGQLLGRPTAWTRKGGEAKVVPDRLSLDEALGFVWSLPVSVLISGTKTPAELRENAAAARAWEQLDETARAALVARAAEGVDTRRVEFYKA